MPTAPLEHLVPLPTPDRPLPGHAAVAIIGGGIMGTSIAFHLAQAGVRDVVLIERDTLGSGSSAKPLGGVRATFSDPGNIQLGQRSLEAFERFDAQFGTDIGLRQVGYLFLCRTEAEMDAVARSAELQNAMGGHTRLLGPAVLTPLWVVVPAVAIARLGRPVRTGDEQLRSLRALLPPRAPPSSRPAAVR